MSVAYHLDDYDSIYYTPKADGTIIPWVVCNDVFGWATADCEDITLENVDEFERCAVDYESVYPLRPKNIEDLHCQRLSTIGILFACRVRKQRPFKHNDSYGVADKIVPFIEAIPERTP
jgi:hypothetical protein